jgi:cytochrome c556
MKKFIVAFVTFALSASLYATEYTKGDRIKDMLAMSAAMELIQKGFLHNCSECIEGGLKRLETGKENLHNVDLKDYLPEAQKYAHKFAKKREERLQEHIDEIRDSLKRGDMTEAMAEYGLVLQNCTSCHIRIRDW